MRKKQPLHELLKPKNVVKIQQASIATITAIGESIDANLSRLGIQKKQLIEVGFFEQVTDGRAILAQYENRQPIRAVNMLRYLMLTNTPLESVIPVEYQNLIPLTKAEIDENKISGSAAQQEDNLSNQSSIENKEIEFLRKHIKTLEKSNDQLLRMNERLERANDRLEEEVTRLEKRV